MSEFYKTKMGRQYYDYTMPDISRSLKQQNELMVEQNALLHEANQLKRRELDIQEALISQNRDAKQLEPATDINNTPEYVDFYEIQFADAESKEADFSYFVGLEHVAVSEEMVINRLKDFIGIDGLTEEQVANYSHIEAISEEDFYDRSSALRPENRAKRVTLNVTFEIDTYVDPKYVKTEVENALRYTRDNIGFDLGRDDAFVEGIIVDMNN